MPADKTPPGLAVGLPLHIGALAVLLGITWAAWNHLGRPVPVVFWCAVALPVVHQVFVWLAWRMELLSSATSKAIGFRGYVVLFFLLFGGRFVALLVLGWMDQGSLGLSPLTRAILTTLLVIPGVYTMYSVQRFFGLARATGADHFDSRYREMPLVNQGVFRFTGNAMYLLGFFLFWAVAVAFDSSAALVVAGFSHLYIWVHYHATEEPDLDYLHAPASTTRGEGR